MATRLPAADLEAGLLAHLNANAEIADSRSFASSLGVTHKELEDVIKSLSAFRIVESAVLPCFPHPPPQYPQFSIPLPNELALPQDITRETWVLTDEAKGYAARGSPEVQLLAAIPPEGASKAALKVISLSICFSCSIGVNGLGFRVCG
jgi:phenylalanyl-tRNA synthetase alpha chain